jgi:hypothetical protein
MRRAIVGLAATAFILLALAGPASAAPGQVFQFKFSGPFASFNSIILTATSEENTELNVSANPFLGPQLQLHIDQGTTQLANGLITGFTDTSVFVTSGFSFEQRGFDRATLTASVPTQTCSFDAFSNLLGCTPTTMNVSLTWFGQGSVQVGVFNDHFQGPGFNEVDHFDGAVRIATATGSVGDQTLTPSTVQSSDLGTTRDGSTFVCIGNNC